jgi:potassium efflux system protein
MRFRALCYLFIFSCFHLGNASPLETAPDIKFDVRKANTQFDQINLKLSVENLNVTDLGAAIEALTELSTHAANCVETAQRKITNLNEMVARNNVLSTPTKDSVDKLYLSNQIKKLESHQAECRLFSIRALEAIDAYKKAASQLVKKVAFTRERSLWNILATSLQNPSAEIISPLLEKATLDKLPSLKNFFLMVSLSVLLSFFLLTHFRQRHISRYKIRKNLLNFYHTILLTATITSGMLLFYLLDQFYPNPLASIAFQMIAVFLGYLLIHLAIIFAFQQPKVKGYFLLHGMRYQYFRQLFLVVIGMSALGLVGKLVRAQFKIDEISMQLGESLYLLSLLVLSLYFVARFCRTHHKIQWVQQYRPLIRAVTLIW